MMPRFGLRLLALAVLLVVRKKQVVVELPDGLLQHGWCRVMPPTRGVGSMALAIEPRTAQAARGGCQRHGAQGPGPGGENREGVVFHEGLSEGGSTRPAAQARTTA